MKTWWECNGPECVGSSREVLLASLDSVEKGARLEGSDIEGHLGLLYMLACMSKGPIVECGVNGGYSTLALMGGAIDKALKMTSYDIRDCRSNVLGLLGVKNPPECWTFTVKSSFDAAADWAVGSVGLMFLDTSHELEDTRRELALWGPKIALDGILCGHDYFLAWGGVKQAVDEYMQARPDLRLQIFEHDQGFFLIRKAGL